jgi:TonB family protein
VDMFVQDTHISSLETVLQGKYRVLHRIGSGGYGEVYLGEHVQLHRKVAIKFLLYDFARQPDLVSRFQREARSAATLIHPNIIDIYDVGERNDIHYFVMKYIEGETLLQKMNREKRIKVPEAIQIIKQLADALDYAHSNNIIHRDVKPSNVMVDTYGKPLLMDFGVARIQFEAKLTGKGRLLGTPHYLSPEQPLGNPIDGRSDIYSLGIMFYEMLSGTSPFHDENSIALVFKHVHEAPPLLRERVPELQERICEVVHKMIEKLPEKRYQTGAELVDALEALSDIYPVSTPIPRRSNPSMAIYNTDKLLLLAREHIEKEKVSTAFQILTTVVKRQSDNEPARKEVQGMVRELIEKARRRMSDNDFRSAREICEQLKQLYSADEEVVSLYADVGREEKEFREAQFHIHFEAAKLALQHNDAASAVSHLAKCSELHPSDENVRHLLNETRDRITSEINLLCEKLDFDTAEFVLYLGQGTFPDLVHSKADHLRQHRMLYQRLQHARDLFKEQKWEPALQAYEEFLKVTPPPGLSVFKSLRAEAEASLKKVRERLQKPANDPQVSKQKISVSRVGWILLIGLLCGTAITSLSVMLRIQDEVAEFPNDLSLIRKLKSSRLKAPVAAQPVVPVEQRAYKTKQDVKEEANRPFQATLTIDTTPNGATILLNQKMHGFTPREINDLRKGTYKVTLRKLGYEDYNEIVTVGKGHLVHVSAQLIPIRNEQPAITKQTTVIEPGMIVPLDANVTPPKIIKKTTVTYPEAAKKRRLSGTIKLSLLVSENGSVIAVRVLKSADPLLNATAIKTVKEWVYEPATKLGVPVSVWIPTTISYANQ